MTISPDGLYQWGGSAVGAGLPAVCGLGGKWLWVDPVNGSSTNDGTTPATALASVVAAEDLLTANKNDGIFLIGGATADVITSAITWDKSYTHLVGVCAPTQVGQRCRVNTTTAMTPMITVSANGCVFTNIQFMNDHSHATAGAVCMKVTGARNYFYNCQFGGRGALAVVDNSHRDLVINSSNGENCFERCTIGNDTMDYGTATNYVLEFNGAVETARNQFIDCIFLGGGSANASFVLATTVSSLSSFQLFRRCLFLNNDNGTMDAMTQGFNINASAGGYIVLDNCLSVGVTNMETSDSNLLITNPAPAAGTGVKGVVLTT